MISSVSAKGLQKLEKGREEFLLQHSILETDLPTTSQDPQCKAMLFQMLLPEAGGAVLCFSRASEARRVAERKPFPLPLLPDDEAFILWAVLKLSEGG